MTFDHLAFFLRCKISKYFSQILPEVFKYCLLPILRNPYNVILAFLTRVWLILCSSYRGGLLFLNFERFRIVRLPSYPRNCETLRVHRQSRLFTYFLLLYCEQIHKSMNNCGTELSFLFLRFSLLLLHSNLFRTGERFCERIRGVSIQFSFLGMPVSAFFFLSGRWRRRVGGS